MLSFLSSSFHPQSLSLPSFYSFRRFTGGTVLLLMTASTATTYLISQSFRFYDSLKPDTILRRDIAIAQVHLFVQRLEEAEEEMKKSSINSKDYDDHHAFFILHHREAIFRQLKMTYEILHNNNDDQKQTASTATASGCCLGSILPRPVSWILTKISNIISCLRPTRKRLDSSSPLSIFYSPWHGDEAILKLRQFAKIALNEAKSQLLSKNSTHDHRQTNLQFFLLLRSLLLVADRHYVDYGFSLKLEKWIYEKKVVFDGFKRGMISLWKVSTFISQEKSNDDNDEKTRSCHRFSVKLRNMKNQITQDHLQHKKLSSVLLHFPARMFDWYSNSFFLKISSWPIKLRLLLIATFDILGHVYLRHKLLADTATTPTSTSISSNEENEIEAPSLSSSSASSSSSISTFIIPHFGQLSLIFFKMFISSFLTKLCNSIDFEFAQNLGTDITLTLARTDLETLEHFENIITSNDENNQNSDTRISSSIRKCLFEPVTSMRTGESSLSPKSFKVAKEVVFGSHQQHGEEGDPDYTRHLRILHQRSEKAVCCMTGSLQLLISLSFAAIDIGSIFLLTKNSNNNLASSSSSSSSSAEDSPTLLHLKGLGVSILWSVFDDAFLATLMKQLFKKPLDYVRELAAYFSKERDETNNSSNNIQNLQSASLSEWKHFLPLSPALSPTFSSSSTQTFFGCDLLLSAIADCDDEKSEQNNAKKKEKHRRPSALLSCLFSDQNESCAPFAYRARLQLYDDENNKNNNSIVSSCVTRIVQKLSLSSSTNKNKNKKEDDHPVAVVGGDSPFLQPLDPSMTNLVSLDRDERLLLKNKNAVQNRLFVTDLWSPFYSISLSDSEFLTLRILGMEVVSSIVGLRKRREVLFEKLLNQTARDVLDPHTTIFLDILLVLRKTFAHRLGVWVFSFNVRNAIRHLVEASTTSNKLSWSFLVGSFSSSSSSSSSPTLPLIPQPQLFSLNDNETSNQMMSWSDCVDYYLTINDQVHDRCDIFDNFIQLELLHHHLDLLKQGTKIDTVIDDAVLQHEVVHHDEEMTKNILQTSSNIKIEFKNVSFGFGGNKNSKMILKNLSFTIHPGETIGIVGPSGCGKSTLLKLLLRLYDVSSGEIVITTSGDEKNIPKSRNNKIIINEIFKNNVRSWRRNAIAFVDQQPLLSPSSTIRENVEFGTNLSREDVNEALKRACCDNFVENNLKYGMNTILGNNLSSGERQRLVIARALAKRDAPILLLDEATSSLDAVTESRIVENVTKQNNINNHDKNNFDDDGNCSKETNKSTTRIIVAHRLSTLKYADRVLVLNSNGTIDEFDTHENLSKSCSAYRELYEKQSITITAKK